LKKKLIWNFQKTALDKPRLNEVSDSASLNEMSDLFHISEQQFIEDQWPQAMLTVDLQLFIDLGIIAMKIDIKWDWFRMAEMKWLLTNLYWWKQHDAPTLASLAPHWWMLRKI